MKTGAQSSILIVLTSVVAAWIFVTLAAYTDLFVTPVDTNGAHLGDDPAVSASTYLLFAAVAVTATAAVVAQRHAIAQRLVQGADSALPRAAHRLATLAIIVAIVAAAIFGFVVFLSTFGHGPGGNVGVRFFTTYLPIILYTAVIVTSLLVGFVFRGDTLPKSTLRHTPPVAGRGASSSPSRALGGAYAVPIIASATALIFGLVVYDLTRTRLELWVWVIIHAMIAAGVIAGTVLAEKAQGHSSESRSRVTGAARTLNVVVSVVVVTIVVGVSFGQAVSAVSGLRISPELSLDIYPGQSEKVADGVVSVNAWDLEPGSAVLVVWADTGETLMSGEAGRFRDFYDRVNFPEDTSPGTYSITGSATAFGGGPLFREATLTVGSGGLVDYRLVTGLRGQESEPIVIAPSGVWLVAYLAPALTLLGIGLTTLYVTVVARNPKRTVASEE